MFLRIRECPNSAWELSLYFITPMISYHTLQHLYRPIVRSVVVLATDHDFFDIEINVREARRFHALLHHGPISPLLKDRHRGNGLCRLDDFLTLIQKIYDSGFLPAGDNGSPALLQRPMDLPCTLFLAWVEEDPEVRDADVEMIILIAELLSVHDRSFNLLGPCLALLDF